ncbi:MAG: dolichol-P-glucose synthetase [Acidobacteria bacterium]|nr:MAG: dolichol-P-glucose synthetase [Acidobacteriota bacterium]
MAEKKHGRANCRKLRKTILETKDVLKQGNESPTLELSIVMPCLNEAETLSICIQKAQQSLLKHDVKGEILVADNGSTDGSQEIARKMGARLIEVPDKGYGSALRGGVAAARGEYIIMGDADDSYNFSELSPFIQKLREGYDLVMGNRFEGTIKPGAMPALHKYVGNPVLTGIGRLLFSSQTGDFHCGLRAFRKDALEKLNLRTTGMEFASEMVVKATLHRMRVAEVPITLYPDGRSRPPHLRSWHDGWRHLRFMFLYSPRWLFLYPGLMLMIIGAMISVWLLPGPKTIGTVTFDVNTLLYGGLAIIIGFEAINFAVFTKVFAISEGLLPEDPRLNKVFHFIKLETGLIVGIVLVLAGLIGSIYVLDIWKTRSFGPLEYSHTLRVVIPAGISLTLGSQTILSSFFLSILGLKRR